MEYVVIQIPHVDNPYVYTATKDEIIVDAISSYGFVYTRWVLDTVKDDFSYSAVECFNSRDEIPVELLTILDKEAAAVEVGQLTQEPEYYAEANAPDEFQEAIDCIDNNFLRFYVLTEADARAFIKNHPEYSGGAIEKLLNNCLNNL